MAGAAYVEPSGGLLREVMDAHGGFAAWHTATAVRAVMSTGGALFWMRTTRDSFRQTEVLVNLHQPRVEIRSFPGPGRTSFFSPDRVWICDRSGAPIADRKHPRDGFGGLGKQLHWDHLDSVYFAGYAVWNYLTAPYLLCRSDVRVEPGPPREDDGETWQSLTAFFPPGFPTHNATQTFYFDHGGRLRRHDYHAEVIGSYAVASHYCDDHHAFGSAVFPTRRRVLPRTSSGRTLPFPTLVWIRVHDAVLERA